MSTKDWLHLLRQAMFYVCLVVVAVVVIFPFLWIFLTMLKSPEEAMKIPPTFLPRHVTLENLWAICTVAGFPRYLGNTILVVFTATTMSVLTSALAGYIFAKFRFVGKNVLFWGILATTMIPFESYMVALYLLMRKINLVDTYFAVMLPLFVTGFGVFFMRQVFGTLPDDYVDAARVDGCSEWRIFARIGLPMVKAPLSALAIYMFLFNWKFFTWPLVITNTPNKFVLEVALATFVQQEPFNYPLQMSAAAFSILPMMVVYMIFRRQFVKGMMLSGLKG